jgi:two-component system, LytTR family, sensor kinase
MNLKRLIYILLRKIMLHAIFWMLVLLFFSYLLGNPNEDMRYAGSLSAFLLPVTMATTYTVIYYLIPHFLLQRKYLLFSLYSIYTLVLSAFAITVSIFYGVVFLMGMNNSGMPPVGRSLLFMMVLVYLVVFGIGAFTLLKHNYSALAENKALENKILEAQLKLKEQELHYLKMQIHPHFLFNTLNTMYGHALQKSEETPDMILKLSNLLDYLLYQVDKPSVSLKSEIDHIKDYISLEQMRFRDNLCVEMDLPSDIENIYIAPMLLIPLVENSFKHGEQINGILNIEITLKADEEKLCFSIKNSIKSDPEQNSKSGIGIKNMEKRLDFLYKDKHSLSILRNSNSFEAQLSLTHSKMC